MNEDVNDSLRNGEEETKKRKKIPGNERRRLIRRKTVIKKQRQHASIPLNKTRGSAVDHASLLSYSIK